MDYDVILTDEQYQRAVQVATLRSNESKRQGLKQAYGAPGYDLDKDIQGAVGEYAYCIYTNQPWSESVNTFKAPDVGRNIQIRSINAEHKGLLVRSKDKEEDIYVLVLVKDKIKCKIIGSIRGDKAKQNKYLSSLDNNRPPAWRVGWGDLNRVRKWDEPRTNTCSDCLGEGYCEELFEGELLRTDCLICECTGKIF